MDQNSLVSDQMDAGARFLSEFDKYAPVKAAFWLKTSESNHWYLYIASDEINDTNYDLGYGEVIRLAGKMQDPNFDPFQVKLVGTDDPMARAVLEIQRRYAGKVPTRYRGYQLGGVSIEEAYLYPPIDALVR